MIPIGIVTRDRHSYLDLTLRSLSAAALPDDQVLVVYDDRSKDKNTCRYLYTNERVALQCDLPCDDGWKKLGLGKVRSRKVGPGIRGKVDVQLLGDKPMGVKNASCRAIKRLWVDYKDAVERCGLILIQDDVVFNPDWLARMEHAIRQARKSRPPLGLLCGMRLNTPLIGIKPNPFLVKTRGVTAQCYYVSPAGLKAVQGFLSKWHKSKQGFDNKMCARIRGGGTGVYMMQPPVCQHVGIVSLVRPSWKWHWKSKKGRVGYQSRGPYPMAKEVRKFAS